MLPPSKPCAENTRIAARKIVSRVVSAAFSRTPIARFAMLAKALCGAYWLLFDKGALDDKVAGLTRITFGEALCFKHRF